MNASGSLASRDRDLYERERRCISERKVALFDNAYLAQAHIQELKESGLESKDISRLKDLGWRSIFDRRVIADMLGWNSVPSTFLPCLCIPYFGPDGYQVDYHRIKPRVPKDPNRKYEAPIGRPSHPYFTSHSTNSFARNDRSETIFFVEGEKKAEALASLGFAAIGLPGVWNFQKKRPRDKEGKAHGPRELLDELASLNWKDRHVVIVFDTDPKRNPQVNHARCELAVLLGNQGAAVEIHELAPLNSSDGIGGEKASPDDCLSNWGRREASKYFTKLTRQSEPRSHALNSSIWHPNGSLGRRVYLDTSPDAASSPDVAIEDLSSANSFLLVEPSYQQSKDSQDWLQSRGISCELYPRWGKDNCPYYEEVKHCIGLGLNPTRSLCSTCNQSKKCIYRKELSLAKEAERVVASIGRAEYSPGLHLGKDLVVVKGECDQVLRRSRVVGGPLADFSEFLNWFQRGLATTRSGSTNEQVYATLAWQNTNKTNQLLCPSGSLNRGVVQMSAVHFTQTERPFKLDQLLYEFLAKMDRSFAPSLIQYILGLTSGELDQLIFQPYPFREGAYRTPFLHASWKPRRFSFEQTVLIVDDTLTPRRANQLTRRDTTSLNQSRESIHRPSEQAIQVPIDFAKRSPTPDFEAMAKFFTRDFSTRNLRIGVFGFKDHVQKMSLGRISDNRELVATNYFWSGRHIRNWIDEHKINFVLLVGTPRIGERAIEQYLGEKGFLDACRLVDKESKTNWEKDYWLATRKSGRLATMRTMAYRHRHWQHIHASKCVREIRSTFKCFPDDVPCVVLCSEDLDCRIADQRFECLNLAKLNILLRLSQLQEDHRPSGDDSDRQIIAGSLISTIKETSDTTEADGVKTSQLAAFCQLAESTTRGYLAELEKLGFVIRVGSRRGWRLVHQPLFDADQISPCNKEIAYAQVV